MNDRERLTFLGILDLCLQTRNFFQILGPNPTQTHGSATLFKPCNLFNPVCREAPLTFTLSINYAGLRYSHMGTVCKMIVTYV